MDARIREIVERNEDLSKALSSIEGLNDFNENAFASNIIISSIDPEQKEFYQQVKETLTQDVPFAQRLSEIKEISKSFTFQKLIEGDKFQVIVRIYTLGNLIHYYAPDYILSPEDIAEVRQRLINEDFSFTQLKNCTGGRGIIWFMSMLEYEKINNRKELGKYLNNSLALGYQAGVGEKGLPEFVAVVYQKEEIEGSYKPLIADSIYNLESDNNFYFLGNKPQEKSGQTNPHSNDYSMCKEYIHKALSELNNYTVQYIGEGELDINESDMIDNMVNRIS